VTRELRIEVFGQPAPQGSKRAFINKHTGRAHVIESSHDRVKSWRQAVLEATLSHAVQPAFQALAGPVQVAMTFRMPRPKSHYRTGRNAHLLRDTAPLWPAGTPDLSKLIRSTEDALTDAGAWLDDAQVVHHDTWKSYAEAGELPGAYIIIREITSD
jgi:Holliday junction resolvase RusA-like endonuclease